jgi:23S rRNA pseudouridine1911/1915/1917 synthase
VHLAHRGYPVVGDPLYLRRVPAAAKMTPASLRNQLLDFPRQALHAASLGLTHPRSGEKLSFDAALPADLAALIEAVDQNRPAG